MSEFHDPELERLLGRAGGMYPDVNVAYERMLRGVRHARRRRLVAVSGAASCLLFLGAAFAFIGSDQSPNVQPGDRGTFDGSFEDTLPDSVPGTTTPTSTDSTLDTETTATRSGTVVPVTTPNSSAGSNPSVNPSSTTPTTAPAPPVTQVFAGTGGSVTVRLQDGTLSLVSYSATAGFTADLKHTGGDRVEVRFESVDHRTDIRIDLELGSMAPTIDENDT
ncbi:MAG: hypothetical protein HY826_05890 [Actinobacteria bacterium]|nr:hypothetical protein [Actinomycetota bacterium]